MKLLDALTCCRAGSWDDQAAGRAPVRLQLLTSSTCSFLRLVLLMPHAWGRVPLSCGLNARLRLASCGSDSWRPQSAGIVPCTPPKDLHGMSDNHPPNSTIWTASIAPKTMHTFCLCPDCKLSGSFLTSCSCGFVGYTAHAAMNCSPLGMRWGGHKLYLNGVVSQVERCKVGDADAWQGACESLLGEVQGPQLPQQARCMQDLPDVACAAQEEVAVAVNALSALCCCPGVCQEHSWPCK